MTEIEIRNKIVSQMKSWLGLRESDGSHKKIVDIYNAHRPLARGYKLKYTDDWCSGTVSAAGIACGMTDIIPPEVSCPEMIKLLKAKGMYQNGRSPLPSPGDIIFFDWDANNSANHVGIVELVDTRGAVKTIEGNISNSVGGRTISASDKTILGYGKPDYKKYAGDDDMDDKRVLELIDSYIAALATKPESDWSAKEQSLAKMKAAGLMDGTAPQGFVTREQLAAVMIRAREEGLYE